jgi:transposase
VRDNDGRKLDHTRLEALRLRAVEEVRQGARPEDVAVTLGMHRKTVYAWLKRHRDGGQDALLAQPVPGRPARLNEQRLADLAALLMRTDPRQFDFEAALWTIELVRLVIYREFGVALSRISVNRQLDKLGFAPGRPLERACERHPDALARWQREELPRISAQATRAGATVYFAGETDARPGNVVAAATAKGGASRFAVFDARAAAERSFTEFCDRLLHDTPGPVYLVTDGHGGHRTQEVADYAAARRGDLKLFYLPA